MSTLTVFSDTTDGFLTATSAISYSDSRAGTGSLAADTASTTANAGQQYSSATWPIYQGALAFDTSALGSGATVSAGALSIWATATAVATDFQLNARLNDWGTSLTTADYVAGASLTGKTLLGHITSAAGIGTGAYTAFTDDAFASNINKTGFTRLILCSSRTESGTAPTANNLTGQEFVTFSSGDASGTTQDPKLVVTYTSSASASAGVSTGTGAAGAPTPKVGPSAGRGTATGSAFAPTPQSGTRAAPGVSTGTGAALAPTAMGVVNAHPGAGAGTGAAFGPTVSALSSVDDYGVEISVWVKDNNGIPEISAILENARAASLMRRWLDVGSGSFQISRADAKATETNLADGNLIVVSVNGVVRGGFFIESAQEVVTSPDGSAGEDATIAGRDITAALDDAIVYPSSFTQSILRQLVAPMVDSTTGARIYQSALSTLAATPATNVKVDDLTGVVAGQFFRIAPNGTQTAENTDVVRATAVGTAGSGGTGLTFTTDDNASGLQHSYALGAEITRVPGLRLAASATAGATNIKYDSAADFDTSLQNYIVIGKGGAYERVLVTAWGTTGSGGTGLTITPALQFSHATNDWGIRVDPSASNTGGRRSFPNMYPGAILYQLLSEAKARGCFPYLSWTFTNTSDSDHLGWSDTVSIEFSAGTSLLDAWRQLVAVGLYTRFRLDTTGGFATVEMDAWQADPGTDRTTTVVLRDGHHFRDGLTRTRNATDTASRVVVGFGSDFEEVLGGAESLSFHREKFLSFSPVQDETTAQTAGQTFLAAATDSAALPVPLIHGSGDEGLYEPDDDFAEGDTIALDIPGLYSLAPYRVVAITWTEADGGLYANTVELNSQALDYTVRLKKELAALQLQQTSGAALSSGSVGTDTIADASITAAKLSPHDDYTMESLTITDQTSASGGLRLLYTVGGGSGSNPAVLTVSLVGAGNTITWTFGDSPVWTPQGLIIPVATGGVFGPQVDGAVTLDTTNHRLYWWENGANHYVARTAGVEVPSDADGVDETICPRCHRPMELGERAVVRFDHRKPDRALHGLYEHERCPRKV